MMKKHLRTVIGDGWAIGLAVYRLTVFYNLLIKNERRKNYSAWIKGFIFKKIQIAFTEKQ